MKSSNDWSIISILTLSLLIFMLFALIQIDFLEVTKPSENLEEQVYLPEPTETITIDPAEALKKDKENKKECENNNGIWMKGPFGEGPFCNETFPDGGKACNDSSDCLSKQCISDLSYSKNDLIGECASKLVNYGCYSLLEKNRITESICVD